ncbi:MAG TPA: hypothetical protein VFT64_07590 [Rickettsiales bacterium]|nr:hypothetical protein [Rickettsiales bacterium]
MHAVKTTVAWTTIGILAVAIGLTCFSPLYPDEFAYKIFLERYFINGGFKQSVLPFCPSGFLVRPGALLVPAAMFWAVISHLGDTWISYRFLPYIGLAFLYGVLIWHNLIRGNQTFWPLLLFSVLGPMLYGITMLRPEILILASCMALYAMAVHMLSQQGVRLYIYAGTQLIIFSFIAFVHPKALYLSVLVIAAIILASANIRRLSTRILYIMLFLGLLFGLIHATIQLHEAGFLSCASIPNIKGSMEAQAANPLDLLKKPDVFFSNLYTAMRWSLLEQSLQRMMFHPPYQVGYLPPLNGYFDSLENVLIVGALLALVSYIIIKLCACLFYLKFPADRKQLYLVISVMISLFAPFFLSIVKHFYEVAFFTCSLMIVAVLLWPFYVQAEILKGRYAKFSTLLSISMPIYMIVAAILGAWLAYHDFTVEFRKGYEGPSQSYMTDRNVLSKKIRQVLTDQQIPVTAPMIIDDITYDAVKYHPVVVPVTYLMLGLGFMPKAVEDSLATYNVHYGIISCSLYDMLKSLLLSKEIMKLPYTKEVYKIGLIQTTLCLFRLDSH